MRAQLLLSAFVAAAFAGGLPATTDATDPTRIDILVLGPVNWAPQPGYELAVSGRSYSISGLGAGGWVQVRGTGAVVVTLRRVRDCGLLLHFRAEPNHAYIIRFDSKGKSRLEPASGADGPGLDANSTSVCQLPETATVSPVSRSDAGEPLAALAAAAFVFFAYALRRRPNR